MEEVMAEDIIDEELLDDGDAFDEKSKREKKKKKNKKLLDAVTIIPRVTTKVAAGVVEAALNYHDFAKTGEPQFLSLIDRLERFAKAFGKNSFLGSSILKWVEKQRQKEAVEKKIEEYRIDALAKKELAKRDKSLNTDPGVKNISFVR